MFIHRQKQKGMVLICAVAILAVLSIMATSFVRMMTLNLQAAKNHLNYVDAKFAAIAGIEDAKAKMWQYMLGKNSNLSTHYQDFFNNSNSNRFRDNNFYNNDNNGDGYKDDGYNTYHFYEGTIGRTDKDGYKVGRYDRHGNRYKFRIRSNQGKLNLNSHRPYDLDYSTTAKANETKRRIKNSNRVMNTIIKYLAEVCEVTNATDLANELRPIDENIKTFNSMQEVELILKKYGNNTEFLNNVCVNSVMDSLCYVPTDTSTSRDNVAMINAYNTSYYREYRSPININSVSKKLLTALIQSINATVYIYSPYHKTVADYGFTESKNKTTESSLKYAIAKYTISFSQSNAETIADTILKSTPYTSIAHIESEIQKLTLDDKITRPSVTYLKNSTNQNYINDVRLTNILKDTLKANFNPNVKENFYNGAYVSARCVQKSDLYSSGNPTHSTELCILDCGYADIESNGIIQARVTNNPVTVAKASIKESISFGTMISATSSNDFSSNSNAWIFPELSENGNRISTYMNNLQSVCGSVQCRYHGYKSTASVTAPANFVKTKDGLLMKDSFNSANTNVYTPSGIESSSIGIASSEQSFKFWVKLAEDWYEPTMCGLFSGSYRNGAHKYTKFPVTYDGSGNANTYDYHDGMQLYVYKNTKGELRLSRLFFCGYFKNGSYYGIESLAIDGKGDLPNSAIAYARRDICIDLSDSDYRWHANEWHCIDVHWSEVEGNNKFYVIIDNDSKLKTYGINDVDGHNTTSSPKFCIINENISDDSTLNRVQMNSMYRKQYNTTTSINSDKRLFRFDTIASLPGNSTMKENSLTDTSLSPLSSYSINFSIDQSDNQTDPNKNPLLNYDRKKVTGWGVIGALTWIAYPEGKQMHSDTQGSNPSLTNGYIKMKSSIHSETSGNTKTIISPTSSTVVGTSFSCSANFNNASKYPTVLDSATLNIMYPVVFSSTIVQ